MAEARQYGVDRMVLARLVNDAALDDEAMRLGLSTGDEAVRAQVTATPAFQGPDGKFSPETYVAALERASLRPADFEALLRRESTRDLLARGVQSATTMPDTEAQAVLAFLGERRSFDWLRLDATLLPAPIPEPTDADLAAEHDAHAADRYTRPETRQVSYASVTPASLAAGIEIPEDELRAAYDAEIDHFETPERRALDRIGFGSEAEAAAAKARIDAGETDFDKLAAERGLAPADMDQGIVAADALAPAARDAVFGAAEPGIVGPVATPLGPALYRVNAIMAPKTVPFEEAKADLAKERALDAARTQILDETAHVQDLIAGGATLEEIASEAAARARPRRAQQPRRAAASPTTPPSATPRSRPRRARRPTSSSSPTAASPPSASTASTRRRRSPSPRSATASPPTGARPGPPTPCRSSPTATSPS